MTDDGATTRRTVLRAGAGAAVAATLPAGRARVGFGVTPRPVA